MGSNRWFRNGGPWVLLFAVAVPFVQADVLPFDYSENFNFFGDQVNNICGRGVCGAIAAINSFVFLENQYPSIYDSKLLPNYDATNNNDPIDAANFAVDGWKVGGNPARQGYYTRGDGANNQDPVWNSDYLATKKDWFHDYAPGTTVFASMWFNGGGGYPTIEFLAKEIQDQEDVEFLVKDTATAGDNVYHALTLTGVSCMDFNYTDCSITYQDPNNPTVQYSTAVSPLGPGGSLTFSDLPGTGISNTPMYIDGAFAESPVPEPGSLLFLATAIAGCVLCRVLSRRNSSRLSFRKSS
jgi:PEP-CTERM motif